MSKQGEAEAYSAFHGNNFNILRRNIMDAGNSRIDVLDGWRTVRARP